MLIGTLKIDVPLFLAPMAGVTDLPFRVICDAAGAGCATTEMVSAKAIFYKNKGTAELLRRSPEEGPLGVQLFGSEPEIMADIALSLEEDFDFIDVNMGCPMPKIVGNGEGSALMRDPVLAGRILEAMAKKLHKPLTVKIRKGYDENSINAVEIARVAEASGAAAIAVHGRTRTQYYSGSADWDIIRQVKEAVRIPVVGNGDVRCGADALRLLRETGCDGIMVGRGAQGNPWVFTEIRAALRGEAAPAGPDWAEIQAVIRRHAAMEIAEKGDYVGWRELRKHLAWYTSGMPGAAALRREASALSDAAGFVRWMTLLRESLVK